MKDQGALQNATSKKGKDPIGTIVSVYDSKKGIAKAMIVSFAEKHQVDLIIVGSHGTTDFLHIF